MRVGRENYSARLRSDETAYVQIIASPDPAVVGQLYALDHVRTTFGRTTCANVPVATALHFPLGNIARANTRITRDESGVFWVEDCGSGRATAVNGTPVEYGRTCAVVVGDVIDLGGELDPATGKVHGIVRIVFRGAQLSPDDPTPIRGTTGVV